MEKATIPVTGLKFTYERTYTREGEPAKTGSFAVSYVTKDNTVTMTQTDPSSTNVIVQEFDRKDPVFIIKNTRMKVGGTGQFKDPDFENEISEDDSFPMYAKTTFKIVYKIVPKMSDPEAKIVDVEKSCTIGEPQKLHVSAGTYDVLPVSCLSKGSDMFETQSNYNYAPELGVSIKTDIHMHYLKKINEYMKDNDMSVSLQSAN